MSICKVKTASKEEWLKLRSNYIGGSDASAVIGMNPYRSPYALWAEKTGKVAGFEGNLTTDVGSYLEDFVAKLFELETGKKVRRVNASFLNDDYPFAIADIDRDVVGEDALLEIKTTNSFPIMKQLRGSDFPEAYYCQVVHYLAVTGKKKAYLAVLINCRDFKVFELERDENEISALMDAERNFWDLVKNDTPPAPDGTDSTSNTISELYPSGHDYGIALDGYARELDQYLALTEQINSLTKLKDEMANKVKDYMKDASAGMCNNIKVSWASQERTSFDSKAFAKANPNIDLTPYNKTSSYRVFKVTKKENK